MRVRVYKFLTDGSTVEMVMYQARAVFQVRDIHQATYFASTIVLYLPTVSEDNNAFNCEEGAPNVHLHII